MPDLNDTEDSFDDLFERSPLDDPTPIRSPDTIGWDWDICRHFIDPLADEIEEWLGKAEDTPEHIEDLRYSFLPLTGIGHQNYIEAWNRAKVWLAMNVSSEFRAEFEKEALTVLDESDALLRRPSESAASSR